MLLCMVAAVVGVLVFLRKRSLLGETLSHATYPGVTAAILLAGFISLDDTFIPLFILSGAFISAILGFWLIDRMEKRLKTSADASLTAILALFFGIGVTIASVAQNHYAPLYRQVQAYLYGQAATMTDVHIYIYGMLALAVLVFVMVFYKELLVFSFDAQFAKTAGVSHRFLEPAFFCVFVLALVIGIRCAGVILMSAMLIAPAAAARQFTNRLSCLFSLAAFFGALSGFLGIYCSVILSENMTGHYAVPTGPTIVLISGGIALYALLLAPKRGLVIRYVRIARFRAACLQENILKAIWRLHQGGQPKVELAVLVKKMGFPALYIRLLLQRLKRQHYLQKIHHTYQLTSLGNKRAARIVRLHRLWEVYLVHSLGLKVERVHKSAEEMEHILTRDLEKKLTQLLDDPKQDPHDQPIPTDEEGMTHVF